MKKQGSQLSAGLVLELRCSDFKNPFFFFKMSSLQLISVLFIMSFRLQFCQILFTHNTWNLGGENALCKWEETGGILDTCSLWLSNILLPFFFFFQVTAPISALDNFVAVLVGLSIEVAKERDFTQAEPMKFKDLGS